MTSNPGGFRNEYEFMQAVKTEAEENGWEVFHIPQIAYKEAVQNGTPIPSGFPDLLLRHRTNQEMVAAELKTNEAEEDDRLQRQRRFLGYFAKYHVPAFVFRYQDWEYIQQMLRKGPPDSEGEIIEPSPSINRNDPWLATKWNVEATILDIAERIASPNFRRGDLAELRRMAPDTHNAPVFWQIMAKYGLPTNDLSVGKWSLIMHGMALMSPVAHDNTEVGKALFQGGSETRTTGFYSELRLNRLLAARGSILRALLVQMFRMMKSAKQPFDWHEMADFILNDGVNETRAEEIRRNISRYYYSAYYQAERRNSPTPDN